jgi:hypothetical protein
MFKFIAGPALGAMYGFTFFEKFIITVLGMMTTVIIVSFIGLKIRARMQRKYNRKKKKKRFTKRNRRIVYLWRHYGEFGVSFFTPLIFSPVIGTLLVMVLGGKRKKVIIYMFISAVFWSLAISSMSEVLLHIFKS